MSDPGAIFAPLGRRGLLPDPRHSDPLDPRALLRHWFVHFSPLYC
jgi:hypothetical protein